MTTDQLPSKVDAKSRDGRNVDERGSQLVFLISQPRAGSTMLSRIIGGHPDIHTLGESWVMLVPFRAHWAAKEWPDVEYMVMEFLKRIPEGENEYREGVRRMYGYLYSRARALSGKRFFLDKTPNYYWIINELAATFPEARFVLLFRNPLAVLVSMLDWYVDGRRWISLHKNLRDLLEAPKSLLAAKRDFGSSAFVTHYETIVREPEQELARFCQWFDVPYDPRMIDYGSNGLPPFACGDTRQVYNQTRPVRSFVDKWQAELADPQVWRLAHDYLQALGPETVAAMGYDFDELTSVVKRHRPSRSRLVFTVPLDHIQRDEARYPEFFWYDFLRLASSIRRRGFARTVRSAYRRLRSQSFPDWI